ncbi:uncharacterized protein LOC144127909 [Amblyomma americanum]
MSKPRRRNYCFAPGCRTGYSGVKDAPKLSLFGVPEDEARRRTWQRNLHRADKPLEMTDAVCELHFEEKYILRDYVHIINGKEVRIPRGKPSLSPDAEPTILPNLPAYLSKKPSRERPARKRTSSQVPSDPSAKRQCAQEDISPIITSHNDEAAELCEPSENYAFQLSEVPKPSELWALHKFWNYDGVAFVHGSLNCETHAISIEKSVFMNYGESPSTVLCRTFVRKTLISEKVLSSLSEGEQVLQDADSLQICKGVGRPEEFVGVPLTERLKQQISDADGLFVSTKCNVTVNDKGEPLHQCTFFTGLAKFLMSNRVLLMHMLNN